MLQRRLNLILIKSVVFWFLLLSGDLHAQDINSLRLSGIKEKVSAEQYISNIDKSLGYRFFYADGLLSNVYFNESDSGKLLIDVLNEKLADKGITYLIYKETNIVFVKREQLDLRDRARYAQIDENGGYYSTVDIGDPMLAGKYKTATLKGFIRNGKTGEPLPGAVIYIEDADIGAVTDFAGFYNVQLPVGKSVIIFSYVGFEEREIKMNMISPGEFDVELFESTIAIDQVVITSNSDANVTSTEISIIRLDAKTINNIPLLMGEPDLMKAMTLLPGIQSAGDLASGFNVRGGSADQNLVLLDDVPVYNSNHLFGMYSVIDTRIIKNLELYKGGAPARFGGRASSVMDVELDEGNYKKFEGNGALGIFSSKLSLQGPIKKEKSSFVIGVRMTYSDWILMKVPDMDIYKSRASFYDFNTKLNFILNHKNRVSFFSYLSTDHFNLAGETDYRYTNRLGSLKWNQIANEKLTYSLSVFASNYQSEATDIENVANASTVTSGITQTGTKFRLLFMPGNKHSVDGGLDVNYFIFSPGEKKPYGSVSSVGNEKLENEQSVQAAAYIQDVFSLGSIISVSAGLRYSQYLLLGPAQVNIYENEEEISAETFTGTDEFSSGDIVKTYGGFEPRVSARINVGASSSLKLGYSRNIQYLHILSNSTVVIPTDTWISSNTYIKPAVSDQVVMGFFRNYHKGGIETSVELYYKITENVLEFKDGAQLVMNEYIERDILSAALQAYGIEFLLRKNSGRLTGWLSYAYSRSFLTTSGAVTEELINDGRKFPSNYDKPHDLSLVSTFKISRRFTVSATFLYSTGRPATFPESKIPIFGNPYSISADHLVQYSDRNKYRMKDYHRMDISLIWDTSLKKNKKIYTSWILSIYNVYGRKNVYTNFYKKEIPNRRNDYRKYAFYELSVIGIPIPSLTYSIRF
ncbi:MAG: carboxypeptidase-like regulatory domain-containing protein [Bacteroidales bacterium]|nr:carboxypeptidase-like regulatory domain-containing protein [Bacteroidales bacterium]